MKAGQLTLPLLILSVLVGSCSPAPPYRHYDGAVWNTTFHITYRSDRSLEDSIQMVMSRVERSLSPFADSSLVTAINLGRTQQTDTLFRRIFERSVAVNRASGGAFDPTVHPLVELWGFGRNRDVAEPSKQQIDSALASVGIGRCHLVDGLIIKASPRTSFDFSSITKGYGCDLVGEMLRRNGCNDFMVEIGGEMSLSGRSPRGEHWRVMIEAPVDNDTTAERKRMAVVSISGCGVATSGNYRNFHDFASGRKGHTISPITGRPVTTATLSATVIAPDAMTADALATACMAMRSDSAVTMIRNWKGVSALLVLADSAGGFTTVTTPGFPKLQ